MDSEATVLTNKPVLAESVGSSRVTTFRTGLASVSRVHRNNWNPGSSTLILNEDSQLKETPVAQYCSMLPTPSSPGPRADSLQIFKGYRSLRAFGLEHQFLRYPMVNVPLKPTLLSGKLLQSSLSRLGSHRLESLSPVSVPLSLLLKKFTGESLTVARDHEVSNTEVAAHNIYGYVVIGFQVFACSVEEPLTTSEHEVRLSLLNLKEPQLSRTSSVGNNGSSEVDGPN